MSLFARTRVPGISYDKKELARRFGFSTRLAMRVEALHKLGIDVSLEVLELPAREKAIEAVLLHPSLLTAPAKFTDELVQSAAAEVGGDSARSARELCVVRSAGRVELVLREGSSPRAPCEETRGVTLPTKDPTLPIRIARGDALPALVRPDEVKKIFTPEEVGKLKLTVLTSTDPDEKIEAIRRIIYSALPNQEKGLLFIRALADESAEVRREAAVGLKTLGLDPDIAEVIKDLSSGTPKQKEFAISRLTRLISDGTDAEKAVVLSVLTGSLKTEGDFALKKEILSVLELLAPMVISRTELLADFHHLLLDELVAHFDALADSIKHVYGTLGSHGAKGLADILWVEVEKVENRKIRSCILMILASLRLSDAENERIAGAIVKEISDWSDLDIDCRRLANTLKHLGRLALDQLLKTFDGVREGQRVFFVRLMDGIANDEATSAAHRNRVAEVFSNAFKTGKRPLRIAILESRICCHPEVKGQLKKRLAADFLSTLHEFRLERLHDLMDATLKKMGYEVIESLVSVVRETIHDSEKLAGVRAIAEILAKTGDEGDASKKAGRAVDFLLGLADGEFPLQGALAIAVGQACSGRAVPADRIVKIAEEFKGKLGRTSYSYDLIEALGWLARGANTPPGLRFEIAGLFLDLLDKEYPEIFSRERKSEEVTTLEIGQHAAAYTVLIPNLIKGLERVCAATDISETLLAKVASELLEKWKEVISLKRVWGPASVTELAESLGRIGTFPHVPPYLRVRIVQALRLRITNMSVARWVGEVLGAPQTSRRLDEMAAAIARELMDMSKHNDFGDPEDQEVIMGALGKIALRPQLGKGKREGEVLRLQVAEVLFTGLMNDTVGVRHAIVRIREAEHLPESFRRKVGERLVRE